MVTKEQLYCQDRPYSGTRAPLPRWQPSLPGKRLVPGTTKAIPGNNMGRARFVELSDGRMDLVKEAPERKRPPLGQGANGECAGLMRRDGKNTAKRTMQCSMSPPSRADLVQVDCVRWQKEGSSLSDPAPPGIIGMDSGKIGKREVTCHKKPVSYEARNFILVVFYENDNLQLSNFSSEMMCENNYNFLLIAARKTVKGKRFVGMRNKRVSRT